LIHTKDEYFNYIRVKGPMIAALDGQFDNFLEEDEKMDECETTGVTKDVIGPLSNLSAGMIT